VVSVPPLSTDGIRVWPARTIEPDDAGAHQAVAITFTCDESHHMAAEALRALESDNMMQNIEVRVDEAISASTILSEGVVQRWFIADGALAETGAKIAEVRVEDALHEITSPASGRLTIIAAVNDVVEPGFLLATLAVASIDTHAGY
jgi:hypothetical protein